MLELNRLYNLDCMQGMKEFPDGFFDLAIVDPPYGIGIDGQRKRVCRNPKHNRKEHSREGWDNKPPTEEYFRELERVSREQIIWGGNYFVPMLKQAHKGWLVWDKGQRGLSMSDCELAYTSFDTPTRIFTNAAGQEAQTSISRGRNARISGVIFSRQCFFSRNMIYWFWRRKRGFVYATDNYSKTTNFS